MNNDIRANILDDLYAYPSIEESVWSEIRSEVCSYIHACSASYNSNLEDVVICRKVGITEEGIYGNISAVVREYVYNPVNK